LEERVVAFAIRSGWGEGKLEWQKIEPRMKDILRWDPDTTFIGVQEDSNLMKLASAISRSNASLYHSSFTETELSDEVLRTDLGLHNAEAARYKYLMSYGPGATYTIVKTSINLAEKLQGRVRPIGEFFYKEDGTVLTVDPIVVKWNTANYIDKHLDEINILGNFKRIDTDKYKKFLKVDSYYQSYFRSLAINDLDLTTTKEFQVFLDNLTQIQIIRKQGGTDEEITEQLKTLTGKEYTDAIGMDLEIKELVDELREYCAPISTMLGSIEPFLDDSFSEELEREIKFYIATKTM